MTKREWINWLESLKCEDNAELEFLQERSGGVLHQVYVEFVSQKGGNGLKKFLKLMSDYILKTKVRNDCRKIHIDDLMWQYKISTRNTIIYTPEGVKIVVPTYKIDHPERTFVKEDGPFGELVEDGIRPSDIKTYIEKNLC